MPSPITPEAVFKVVFKHLEENGIEMSSHWGLWLSSNHISDEKGMKEESLKLSKSFQRLSGLGFMFQVLTEDQSYEKRYSCTIYSGKIVLKEHFLRVGIRHLKKTMREYKCTVYSALWDMLFDSEWMPVKKDENGLYEFGDWGWESLDKLLCEKFPEISDNFVALSFDV